MSYERLIAEHARIDVVRKQLEALVAAPEPDLPAVLIALSDLSRELSTHLAHEDSFIYLRMIGGTDAVASEIATKFIAEFAGVRENLDLYLHEWNSECIAGDWEGFRQETEKVIAQLVRRIRAENELLYTVALKTSAITLRDPG